MIQVIDRKALEEKIPLSRELVKEIEHAFTALVTEEVTMPEIMRIDIPEFNGEVDIKSAYIPGYDSFCVKLSSGFFDNPEKGLPSANGLMILISSETGEVKQIFADQGLLTDLRTAAAGAVAAKHVSRENSERAGILGTGAQARYQLEALTLVRPIKTAYVWGRTPEKATAFQKEMEEKLGISITVGDTAEEVVRNSDIVVTTTPSSEPIVQADWLHPGLHITAMGSDAEHKQELSGGVIQKADVFTCDVLHQSRRLGELRTCNDAKIIENTIELGEVTGNQTVSRTSDNQITITDLSGTGVQDTAIARYTFQILGG
ncbi:cyclodeaminase [Salimicrobium flavidum]|uniref:Ornithine cyclodeaminase n=1 Tax=Salimicrobium flavidum TaxID=570947 RepID=A0A1N7IML7_9BACI|nr:cyclodeaminase [Salimicrobium flavidum]SIS38319.1 ornithine cyclodeaminase [Salimicrobium flavidum]